jgi:hypothetical protein
VVERASLFVVSAWPIANSRIHHRQVALLLPALCCCRFATGEDPVAQSCQEVPAFQFRKAALTAGSVSDGSMSVV